MKYLDRSLALGLVRVFFLPIIRFGLRHSLRVQDLIEQVKVGAIKVAQEEIEQRNQEANICRLSAATGLHRRDVRRIFSRGEEKPSSFDLLTRVIGVWQSNRKFLSTNGKPRVLTVEGPRCDFQVLMESIATDLTAGTVLFELERLGAIQRVSKGIKLVYQTLSVRHDSKEGFEMLGDDIEDLILSVEENLLEDNPERNLHAKTVYDNIPQEDLGKVQRWIIAQGASFHRELRQYLSGLDLDLRPNAKKTPGGKVVFATFSRVSRKK